jgi:hypothetical protein
MRVWPARILFAGLLVGSLAAKDGSIDVLPDTPDLEPTVIRVAQAGGLAFRQKTTFAGTDIPVLTFGAADCSLPVLVALLSLTLEEDPTIRSTREPGYALRALLGGAISANRIHRAGKICRARDVTPYAVHAISPRAFGRDPAPMPNRRRC